MNCLIVLGMAVHIPLGFIYISDTSGSIFQLAPSKHRFRTLLTESHIHGYPLSLSIDWLYGHLYYIVHLKSPMDQMWQIWRCDLNGKNPVLIHRELQYEPRHLQVDPYNGCVMKQSCCFMVIL